MPSPLTQAGAVGEQSKYAPLFTNRFFTGLWTQRNPLRDAAVPHLYEKFYGGSRFESLLGGLNRELSANLTLRRRYGHSVYNSQTFPSINRFYEFKVFSTSDEIIRLMADCEATVYDATGPNTKTAIWTKSAGAGDTTFQSVGNTLYFGNGVDQKKWVQSAKSWAASTLFRSDEYIIDAANNIQVALGALSATVINVTIASNVVTLTTKDKHSFVAGMVVPLSGFAVATYLNGVNAALSNVTANQFSFPLVHANVSLLADTGTAATTGGNTGLVQPTWPTTPGSITQDGSQQWYCFGSSVMNWGITAPASSPSVNNAPRPTAFSSWAANTFFSPFLCIVDSNNNIQQLTTGGQLGAVPPTWNVTVGGTTADNTAVWTNLGPAAWPSATAVVLGSIIRVQYSYWVTVPIGGGIGPMFIPLLTAAHAAHTHGWFSLLVSLLFLVGLVFNDPTQSGDQQYETYRVSIDAFYKCTQAGTTGAAQPNWQDGTGVIVQDNTAQWTNIGNTVQWATIGASTLVSVASVILDPSGNKQSVTIPGKSGAVAPTWNTTTGANTTDGTITWKNGGPVTAATVKPWLYAYSFRNSVTRHTSTASPQSAAILESAGQMIQVQGIGSTDPQVDTIRIWRTAQGGSLLLYLADIPAPAAGQVWTYNDTDYDDALNFEIAAPIASINNPPPAGAEAPSFHMGRVWVATENVANFSNSLTSGEGVGFESFSPSNYFIFPSKIKRFWPTTIGLLVHTVSDIYIILGKGTDADPFYCPGKFLEGVGLLSYDAHAVNGTTAYLFTTARKLISLDPGAGVTEVGFPIGDLFAVNYDAATAVVTWHEGTSGDSALYVADGFTGWYRMAPVSAPETGFVWSPRAIVTGGCQAVQSVEVQPGIKKLLVGPGIAGGVILERDSSTYQDNGVSFVAYEIIGSIVLAQPGQTAELEFFTLDSVRAVGTSRPTPSILLGEISGAFENLVRNAADPPLLPRSKTTFNDRYYCSSNQKPTYCRHFQLRIDWAAENSASELLAYTIYGAIHNERR